MLLTSQEPNIEVTGLLGSAHVNTFLNSEEMSRGPPVAGLPRTRVQVLLEPDINDNDHVGCRPRTTVNTTDNMSPTGNKACLSWEHQQ